MPLELTDTERRVLEARLAGETLKEIAARMGLHWGTVSGYQNRAIHKLIGDSRARRGKRLRLARREWERLLRDDAVRAATGDIIHGITAASTAA